MGGIIGANPLLASDIASIISDLRQLGAIGIRILPNPLQGEQWDLGVNGSTRTLPRLSHVLDLDGGFDKVQSELFSRTARKRVRKAERAGLEIERDTTGRLLPIYHELYKRSIDRWARQSREPRALARLRTARHDPLERFEFLAKTFGDRFVTWVAWHDGKPAAAHIILNGNSYFGWRGAIDDELASDTGAAFLLQHVSIEDACNAGASFYYFGESGRSKGVAEFKERFGSIGYPYPEIRIERIPFTAADQMVRSTVKYFIARRG
jgi:hypothetical protein